MENLLLSAYNNIPQVPLSDDKPPKKQKIKIPYDMGKEMVAYGKSVIPYDEKPIGVVVKSAATQMGVNPSLLMSSAWQEGMNKAILKPDEVSNAYARNSKNLEDFPVDGFYNYGLDRFGDNYNNLKKYLPVGFEQKFKLFKATNEKNENVNTAAFKTNEDALIAKAAMMREAQDNVNNYIKKAGIGLNDEQKDYFTLAAYNAGMGNAKKMLDEFASSDKKDKFISEGHTKLKDIHKNINSRMNNKKIADELLK